MFTFGVKEKQKVLIYFWFIVKVKMKKAPQDSFSINETLNELLMKILSGVDYVSRLALETHKSIPVVYRQLDFLVELNILSKHRQGKKVVYDINWVTLSDTITAALFMDIAKVRKLTNARRAETKIIAEINALLDELPKELLENEEALQELVHEFFNNTTIEDIMKAFFKEMEEAGKELVEYNRLAFRKSIDLFLDTFGMLTEEEQKHFLKSSFKTDEKNIQTFLRYCRLRYLQKQLEDPRASFVEEHLKAK